MPLPPFVSDLFYSVQNEDANSELAILQRLGSHRLRVLMIASSGENALSLLCRREVALVDAVDISLAQIHLCALRAAAAEHLSRDEQLILLGSDPARAGQAGAPERFVLYDQLRPKLPADTCAFWDARRESELAFGVQQVGRNDCLMQDLAAALAEAGIAPLGDDPASIDEAAWVQAYQRTFTPDHIQQRFGFPNPAVASRLAALAPHLAAQHLWALRQPNASANPYVTTVFAASYATAAGEAGLPLYLQGAGQAALRELGIAPRLNLHCGNLLALLPQLNERCGGYHLISLSNIADWMDEPQIQALVEAACASLLPGGALLIRAANPSASIRPAVAAAMDIPAELDVLLPSVERGPWFRTLAVGFKRLAF